MDSLMIAAAGGMRTRMDSLDLLANNMANADTSGYKTDREFYSLYVSEAAASGGPEPTALPVVESTWTDFSQGILHQTSNPLDFAIDGKGFFAVDSKAGVAYTRNGSFRLATNGTLTTPDGYAVRSVKGAPLKLDAAAGFEVASDGTVTQSGQVVGQLAVVDFTDAQVLSKQGSNYYRSAPKATPVQAKTAVVHQGRLEGSNVGSAESAVRLVNVMRQFEMLQRAAAIGSEMNGKAIEEVARVGS